MVLAYHFFNHVCGVIFTYLLTRKDYRNHANFILLSILILGLNYHQVNPEMERYWTHMIPFMLIPAAYGLTITLQNITQKSKLKLVLYIITILILIYQTVITFNGIKNWGGGVCFGKNYEEEIANRIKSKYIQKQDILLTSLPEPYYYTTKQSTVSLTDYPPFIYIEDSYRKNLLIIQDMGMYELFPEFSKFIQKNLQKHKLTEFHTNNVYHYGSVYKKENKPVIIYRVPIKELQNTVRKITN